MSLFGSTRRNLSMGAGMAAAVILTISALIASTAEGQTPALVPGTAAPDFTAVNSKGESVSLSDFDGEIVVLEWTNHGCPYVKAHYNEAHSNMQTLQADAAEDGVVWLSVISSAPGEQGHVDGAEADELTETRGASPAHVLLDESGDVGRLYRAKTTPHMFVIAADGTLAYDGAIDSIPSGRVDDIPDAEPWLGNALAAVQGGATPDPAATTPYGCTVKY